MQIVVHLCNDAQNVNYDCGIHEHYLNIELTWQQHLTSGKILRYVNVNHRNGKSFGIVITFAKRTNC